MGSKVEEEEKKFLKYARIESLGGRASLGDSKGAQPRPGRARTSPDKPRQAQIWSIYFLKVLLLDKNLIVKP